MPKKMPAKAWELFHTCFKDGEEVIIIDEDDKFYWGKLEIHEKHCLLHRPEGKKPLKIDWIDVAFISHDGFPVKKMMENDRAAKALEKEMNDGIPNLLRAALTKEACQYCGLIVEHDDLEYDKYTKGFGGEYLGYLHACSKCRKTKLELKRGDPWEIELYQPMLFHCGNKHRDKWLKDDEEILVGISSDGAIANIWCLDTIFNFELGKAG
jgi:hypothetical protein